MHTDQLRASPRAATAALLLLLAGCASAPSAGGSSCPRPDVDAYAMEGLPADWNPATLAGRWSFTVVTASGVEEPRTTGAPLVLQPAPDSLYVHPFCLEEGESCAVQYPLRGHVERPLDVMMSVLTEPGSDDPMAPGAVLEWVPERREATLVFGNPPVRGRLALDAGAHFSIVNVGPRRFTGFWNDGGLGTVIALDGRRLGVPGGWFCAERGAREGPP